jgi:hypothetical protein
MSSFLRNISRFQYMASSMANRLTIYSGMEGKKDQIDGKKGISLFVVAMMKCL